MPPLRLKSYVVWLYLATLLLFAANKFVVRPIVLESDSAWIWRTLVWSVPNAFEGVVGMCNVGAILMVGKMRHAPGLRAVSERVVYLVTALIAAIYVLTQEFGIHHLGGRNTPDPYDALASVIGILAMLVLFLRYGIFQSRGET